MLKYLPSRRSGSEGETFSRLTGGGWEAFIMHTLKGSPVLNSCSETGYKLVGTNVANSRCSMMDFEGSASRA